MSSKAQKSKREGINYTDFVKYMKARYSEILFEFWVLFFVIFILLVLFLLTDSEEVLFENKATYFFLFLFCGVQIFLMAILNIFDVFKKFLFSFIMRTIFLNLFALFAIVYLAFGGLSTLHLLEFLEKTSLIFLLVSLSSKFVAFAVFFYSVWMFFFLLMPKRFYAISEKMAVLNKRVLPVSFYAVLFYPAFYYYVFSSKLLLRQLLV